MRVWKAEIPKFCCSRGFRTSSPFVSLERFFGISLDVQLRGVELEDQVLKLRVCLYFDERIFHFEQSINSFNADVRKRNINYAPSHTPDYGTNETYVNETSSI
jgi:hypothetical protein